MIPTSKIVNYHLSSECRLLAYNQEHLTILKKSRFSNFIIKILLKFKVIEYKREYERKLDVFQIELDLEFLGDTIRKELSYFREKGRDIEKVIVGREQYYELLKGDLMDVIFDVPSNSDSFSYIGVRVQLNPYIDGVVFLPKEKW